MALRLCNRRTVGLLHSRLLSTLPSSSSRYDLQPTDSRILWEALPASRKFSVLGFSSLRGFPEQQQQKRAKLGLQRLLSTEASTEEASAGENAAGSTEYPLPAPPPGNFDDFPDATADFDDDYVSEEERPPDPELDLLYSPSEDE